MIVSRIRSLGRSALAAVALLASAMPALADVITPRIEVDKPVVLSGREASVYLLVRLEVRDEPSAADRDRPRLNLALVLDRSGSMEEKGKLEYLKAAAKTVVDSLEASDRLAVVEYDDVITVMWPSAPVEATAMIKRLIDELQARGATDLAGGMMKGVDEVRRSMGDERINRVLLLSDGLANRGVTDPFEIRHRVGKAKRQGVRVSALGLGLEYNEDLMQDIARNGGGNYYYIESPNQMAGIFKREIQTLFRTAARDAVLKFRATPAVRKVQVYGVPADTEEATTIVELEDFHAGETRSLLLRLEIEPKREGSLDLGSLTLAYKDVKADRPSEFKAEVAVRASGDETVVAAARNADVAVEVALVEAEAKHEEAVRTFQAGDYDKARRMMRELATGIASENSRIKDARLAAKVEALQVEEEKMNAVATAPAAAAPALMSGFVKGSKQRLYEASQGSRSQYMMQQGDQGFEVERLQQALTQSGHYKGPVDGRFGPEVRSALEAFQKDQGLNHDGIAGPATMDRLKIY